RGLVNAGLVQRSTKGLYVYGRPYHLVRELPRDVALNQPLSPFALAALSLLDKESPTFYLDVISVFESILDDPRQVLQAQQSQRRGEEIAALKAEGVDYTERMAIVEDVTWPKPLEELLEQSYDTFAESNQYRKRIRMNSSYGSCEYAISRLRDLK